MTRTLLPIILLLLHFSLQAQNTTIPDSNFEQALISLGHDTILDGSVRTSNINSITQIDLSSRNINDLTGIQDFTALSILKCNNNNISSISLSALTQLGWFEINGNQLTSIDVSNNLQLSILHCASNNLTTLDVSLNSNLTELHCGYNNTISSLILGNKPSLWSLTCMNNQLTSIDLSTCPALQALHCLNNNLSELILSENPNVTALDCSGNNLQCLNLDTLSSTSSSVWVNSLNNNNLTCIEVEDSTNAANNWSINIDSWTSLSDSCGNACSTVVGVNENEVMSFSVYPNPTAKLLNIITDHQGIINYSVSTIVGRKLSGGSFYGDNVLRLDLSTYPDGIYFIQLEVDGELITKKIVKE